eukprot:481558_1
MVQKSQYAVDDPQTNCTDSTQSNWQRPQTDNTQSSHQIQHAQMPLTVSSFFTFFIQTNGVSSCVCQQNYCLHRITECHHQIRVPQTFSVSTPTPPLSTPTHHSVITSTISE